jgi:hypothetical protein
LGWVTKALCGFVAVLELGTGSCEGAAPGQAPMPKTTPEIKAYYVYNFAMYTSGTNWPPESSDSFVVGVVGQGKGGDMFDALEKMLGQLQVKGRPIKVVPYRPEEPAPCQVLFFAKTFVPWRETLAKLRSGGILTVSEIEGFSKEQGMIELVPELRRGRINFEVNVPAGQAAGLTFDTRLLGMASKVISQNAADVRVAREDGG